MPCSARPARRAASPNCGKRREPGKRRTSATASIRLCLSSATNSCSDRVEWPMVQTVCGSAMSVDLLQRASLVHGDMVSLVALDLVLRLLLAGVARMAFVLGVASMHLGDLAADPPSLGVPADMIADVELLTHDHPPS